MINGDIEFRFCTTHFEHAIRHPPYVSEPSDPFASTCTWADRKGAICGLPAFHHFMRAGTGSGTFVVHFCDRHFSLTTIYVLRYFSHDEYLVHVVLTC